MPVHRSSSLIGIVANFQPWPTPATYAMRVWYRARTEFRELRAPWPNRRLECGLQWHLPEQHSSAPWLTALRCSVRSNAEQYAKQAKKPEHMSSAICDSKVQRRAEQ